MPYFLQICTIATKWTKGLLECHNNVLINNVTLFLSMLCRRFVFTNEDSDFVDEGLQKAFRG